MTDTPLGSCGPVQNFQNNTSAQIKSAVLYERADGTHYVSVEWAARGCFLFHRDDCPGTGFGCDLTVTVKVSWNSSHTQHVYTYNKHIYTYNNTAVASTTVNVGVTSVATSFTVEVKTEAKCYCMSSILILTDEAICSCGIST